MAEDEKIIEELEQIFKALKNPVRLKIVQLLRDSNTPISFTEVKNQLGEEYDKDVVWLNLKNLGKNKIINNEKKFKKTPGPGKPQVTFYKLTKQGEIAVDYLNTLIESLQKLRYSEEG